MASRFFATGSSSESESSSSDNDEPIQPKAIPQQRFFLSDSEEEVKRVVRSAKSKRHEEIMDVIKQIKNQKKIRDVSRVLSSFDDLIRVYQKAQKVLCPEGTTPPRFYVRTLVELEEFVNECWEDKKKLSKMNAKALSTLRQKLRKYCRDYEEPINEYKENPDVEKEEEEEEEEEVSGDESESDDEEGLSMAGLKRAPSKPKDDDSDSDSSFWDDSTESESSSSDAEAGIEGYGGLTAAYFLKSNNPEKEVRHENRRLQRRKEREARRAKQEEEEEGDEEWTKVTKGLPISKVMFDKGTEITHSLVIKKLHEIVSARGRKGTNRKEQIELLRELRAIASQNGLGVAIDLKVLFNITAAIFDYNPNVATCMKPDMWAKCLDCITEMLEIQKQNSDITINENVPEDAETLSEKPYRIRGCVLTIVERMDKEFTKILQSADAHSTEFVERLKDETRVTKIITTLQSYLEERGSASDLCRIYMRHINHIYYKYDYDKLQQLEEQVQERRAKILKETQEGKGKDPDAGGDNKATDTKGEEKGSIEEKEGAKEEGKAEDEAGKKDGGEEEGTEKTEEEGVSSKTKGDTSRTTEKLMDRMCKFIYSKDTTDLIRTRAMLCHIYHHALHDRWYMARDLILMSHLQSNIQHSDIPTQILYNRTMVQLGLCAFRHGNIKDAHHALLDIQSGGRAKELLAQGLLMQRQQERDPTQEKIEKSRQLPFHMHINLELLECVYLVSAMLLEIPYMASHNFDIRRRMISKSFHHQLRLSERQTLVGPPESMREHVVAASRSMRYGNWRACRDYLLNDKMNGKVWNLFPNSDHVRQLITRKIQEESLRTYLFTYGSVYDSMSMNTLADMFELEKPVVHSIISKMIINEELMASWDEPAQTVVMHRCEPTKLQSLALRLADKVNNLVENGERLLEYRQNDGRGFGKSGGGGGGGGQGYRDKQGERTGGGGGGGGFRTGRSGYRGDRSGGGNYRGDRGNYRSGRRGHQSNY
ncbi:eukaryotic translation initiation factor 3 subunit C-like isoform X2 [Acanthaster planci]|uniref:Eukaryotic translation initiation factor 3 subunit C n=1 Tax=Acanthaster planci TaxID=133434 RepID=A0A8B7YYH8_ACAPL|nr:eukaryotic translation initiation factor 3 subunit C-like isoform X2 [Acanthaster planci]